MQNIVPTSQVGVVHIQGLMHTTPGMPATVYSHRNVLASAPTPRFIHTPLDGISSISVDTIAGAPNSFPVSEYIAPEVAKFGQMAGENALKEAKFAYENNIYEPQDFKPADDDPGRFYPLRQLDGNWTNVTRATIDKLPSRWYLSERGFFYAVRLDD